MPLTTAPATPKKKHRISAWAVGISLAILALIGGELIRQAIATDEPSTTTSTAAPAETTEPTATDSTSEPSQPTDPGSMDPVIVAANESSLWTDAAVSDLEAAQAAANAGDVELAASNTYLAAEDYAAVADIWRGVDPYVAKTADAIANHLYGVADDISNYRFTRATSSLYEAMDDMDALTQYVGGLA
jgi:hypothetical protein